MLDLETQSRSHVSCGMCLAGDEDGIWDTLREAQGHIRCLANILNKQVSGTLDKDTGEWIPVSNAIRRLESKLGSAILRVKGTRDDGM
jgi:hypothetical protein